MNKMQIKLTHQKLKNSILPSQLNSRLKLARKNSTVVIRKSCALYTARKHRTNENIQTIITNIFNIVRSAASISDVTKNSLLPLQCSRSGSASSDKLKKNENNKHKILVAFKIVIFTASVHHDLDYQIKFQY